jgi:hypothetical protein
MWLLFKLLRYLVVGLVCIFVAAAIVEAVRLLRDRFMKLDESRSRNQLN